MNYKYYIVCYDKKEKWNKVSKYPNPDKFTMRSMFLYDDDAVKYIKQNDSIRGYQGKKRAKELIIDFDNHGQNPSSYKEKRSALINFLLKDFDYDAEIWGTCIQEGSRLRKIIEDTNNPSGLHIRIPFSNEIDPDKNIHHKLRYIANNILDKEYIDENIYTDHRLIRVENSNRIEKPGFGKYLIDTIENRDKLTPSLLSGYTDPVKIQTKISGNMHDWHRDKFIRRCLFEGTIPLGKRHKWVGSACHILKNYGLNREQATPIILAILANCKHRGGDDNPLENGALERILGQNYG